jgi:uncharacterized membrane protein
MGATSSLSTVPSRDDRELSAHLHWPRYHVAGTTGALLFACASFTPSLLPRSWVMQGVVNGLSAAFGYSLGILLAWVTRRLTRRTLAPATTQRLRLLIAVFGVPLVAWTLWLGQRWQRQVNLLTGEAPPQSYAWVRILLLTLAVLLTVLAVAHVTRWVVRWLTRPLVRMLPRRIAGLAPLLVILLLIGLNDRLLWRGLLPAADQIFGAANGMTDPGTVPPPVRELSGSPASLVSWASLGRQGRDFVTMAPSVRSLSRFVGAPAEQPVRVYVGLKSAPTTSARAALAVRELRRAGGFDRAVLLVATTTGTGWVDPAATASLEYMYGGDTAVVAMQYSYIPSWISFLTDHSGAVSAGRELFDQVHAAWAALPPGHRPKLLVTGSSFGALGSEAAFASLADVRARTDGVVWAGTPVSGGLHRYLVEHRRPGTPERLPVYGDGRTVRFADTAGDLRRPATPWRQPRVLYLQNASDPVVFWSPRLLFQKPAWLSEPRSPDVPASMRWIPVVTFWQVTADLPFALDVPAGHGHNYRDMFVDAWAAVAAPPGWTAADTRRLHAQVVRAVHEPPGGPLPSLSRVAGAR